MHQSAQLGAQNAMSGASNLNTLLQLQLLNSTSSSASQLATMSHLQQQQNYSQNLLGDLIQA